MGFRLNLPPVATCVLRKKRHHSRAEALGMIERRKFEGTHRPELGPLVDYWCRVCLAYHIGHKGDS